MLPMKNNYFNCELTFQGNVFHNDLAYLQAVAAHMNAF